MARAAEPVVAVANVADAMAKLSLDTLPGNGEIAKTTVPSYDHYRLVEIMNILMKEHSILVMELESGNLRMMVLSQK